jgi:hypothetical protein
VIAAPRLPIALSPGDQRRTPINTPSVISTMPMMFDAPCTLVTPYIQLNNGLLASSGWIHTASNSVNFARPKATRNTTSP